MPPWLQASVRVGDTIEYHAVSPFGAVEVIRGILYLAKNGQPKVRTASGVKAWHKGYRTP